MWSGWSSSLECRRVLEPDSLGGYPLQKGDDIDEGGAVQAVLTNGRRSTRSSASSLGSPAAGKETKGKGKILEEVDEDEDVDADGDYEEDDMDVDGWDES